MEKIEGKHEFKSLGINPVRNITSYLSRAFTLSIILSDQNLLPWYYQHYLQICSQTDDKGYTVLDFMEPRFPKELIEENFFGYEDFEDSDSISEYIMERIDENFYLVLCLDEYYLRGKITFGKQHFVHESMMYGYDNTKRKFMALGYDQNMMFSEMTFDYRMVGRSFEEGKKYYKQYAAYAAECAVGLVRLKKAGEPVRFNLKRFVSDLENVLLSRGSFERVFMIMTSSSSRGNNIKYGFDVYELLMEKLENVLAGNNFIDYRSIHVLAEHKKILYERFCYIANTYPQIREMERLCKKYYGIVMQFESIRLKSLKLSYAGSSSINEKVSVLVQIRDSIKKLKDEEKTVLTEIYESMKAEANV